jgi:hypothetical protein
LSIEHGYLSLSHKIVQPRGYPPEEGFWFSFSCWYSVQ